MVGINPAYIKRPICSRCGSTMEPNGKNSLCRRCGTTKLKDGSYNYNSNS